MDREEVFNNICSCFDKYLEVVTRYCDKCDDVDNCANCEHGVVKGKIDAEYKEMLKTVRAK